MNANALKDRRMFAVGACSIVVMAACASWIAHAGEHAQAPSAMSGAAVLVQDKEQESSLPLKLFLHRQGFFAQPVGSADK